MKTNVLLLLASLAVLASSASAATAQNESEPLVLPTYVVSVPRETPVVQHLKATLDEFRQQARASAMNFVNEVAAITPPQVQCPPAVACLVATAVRVAKS